MRPSHSSSSLPCHSTSCHTCAPEASARVSRLCPGNGPGRPADPCPVAASVCGIVFLCFRGLRFFRGWGTGEPHGGIVVSAQYRIIEKIVGMKTVQSELSSHTELRNSFIREAKIQARLYHPDVVGLYNFFEQSG